MRFFSPLDNMMILQDGTAALAAAEACLLPQLPRNCGRKRFLRFNHSADFRPRGLRRPSLPPYEGMRARFPTVGNCQIGKSGKVPSATTVKMAAAAGRCDGQR